jgi:two-component system, OmpR family, response regulator
MKILLIEDNKETAAHIAYVLRMQGHDVEKTENGADGLARARAGSHDVLIVDRMLPELDGLSLTRKLRAEDNQTPVLFLTAMGGLDDRVQGLESGGDDYLTKPFTFEELLARVHTVTRRRREASGEPVKLVVGPLELDLIQRSVKRDDKAIALLPQEFLLLEYLMRNAGHTITRSMLLEHVWDLHFDPRTSIVETHMSRLRAKVDRDYREQLIHTQRGVGYILRAG